MEKANRVLAIFGHDFIDFIDFAMWLNPAFKAKVLKFVYDELLHHRHEAGAAYRSLSSAMIRITPKSQAIKM